jgi:transmembrane E3 ubiquitin-protein ligase
VVYDGRNITTIHSAAGGWNWTGPLHASLSLFSYKSVSLPANSPLFYRFRVCTTCRWLAHLTQTLQGFIELGPPNPEQGLLPGPIISLGMEGVHIPHNGSLIGLVEPKGIIPDIRQLSGLVPPGFVNATNRVVEKQLMETIDDVKSIQVGNSQIESDEVPRTRCSFTFHGQVRPLLVHREVVEEYERELQNPSGVPVENLLPPSFDGVLMSQECGILLELETVTGTP